MAIFIPLVTKFDDKGLRRAQSALDKFGGMATRVAQAAAAAVAGVAIAGVREAVAFESSLAKIEGLVGVTGSDLEELANKARELGPAFGSTANEAADALFFITSAGLRGSAAVDVLEASLKGSAIGLGETKTIADLATSAVNAYGEANLSGSKAVDVLTEAVRLGKLEPAELAQTMGSVLPIASNLGVSFAEVGAAMAGMSKTGTDAATASTQLRQILNTLAKPTAEANRGLADMGLSAEGLRQQIKDEGLFATLETLTTAFDGNIEATTQVFGNIRALSGVLDLMGASVDDNRELFALMTDEVGVLDEAFAVASDTTEFKFNKAMASVKEILMEIGLQLLDRLLPYLDQFQAFVQENGPFIEETFDKIFGVVQTLVEKFQEFADTVFPKVKELLESEAFRTAIDDIWEGLTGIVDQVIKFIQSDFGQFLLDLTSATIITGLKTLAAVINGVNAALEKLNELLSGRAVKSGVIKISGTAVEYQPNDNTYIDQRYGRRAQGGLVSGMSPYLVGEMGPEIFIPQSAGNIIPNRDVVASTSNAGATYNITVNAGMGTDGTRLGEQIVNAIKRYERTSGPVFASA